MPTDPAQDSSASWQHIVKDAIEENLKEVKPEEEQHSSNERQN